MRTSDMLTAMARWLENPNNEALVLAEDNEDSLNVVADACVEAAKILKLAAEAVDIIDPPTSAVTPEIVNTLAEIASAFDESGDPELKKNASAIDELLLTISAPPRWAEKYKEAQETRIETIRQEYDDAKKELHDTLKVSDTKKAIENSPYSKEYRIMEHALNTRTCPDHPGAQMARVGEHMYQCDLDKKVYDYKTGYTDEKGNKIPGGDVAAQTPNSWAEPQTMFDTRETRLNGFDVFNR